VLQLLYDILSPSESGLLAAQIGVALIERGCTRFHRDSGERAVPFMQHYPELMEFVPDKHEHFSAGALDRTTAAAGCSWSAEGPSAEHTRRRRSG